MGLGISGAFFLGRWSEADPSKVRQHVLGWTIKAFFCR
jgi:hypothetical protein